MWHPVAFTLLLGVVNVAPAAEQCDFLSVSTVNAALPKLAPWEDRSDVGMCRFASPIDPDASHRARNSLSVDQTIKRSPADAEQWVRSGAITTSCERKALSAPGLGVAAYACRPRAGSPFEGHAIIVVGHDKRIVVAGSLKTEGPIEPEHVEVLTRFVRAGLKLADAEETIEARWKCPWLDTATLEKLLRGKGFGQESGPAGTCIAQAEDGWVRVVTGDAEDAADLQPTVGVGCTTEPLAALGKFGSVSFACKNGPRAEVHMVAGTNFVEYVYEPGREPTPAERASLIDLAKHAQAASRGKQ